MIRPRIRMPFDSEDRHALGIVLVYSLLVLWAAVLLGVAVRLFLMLGFGGL